MSHTVLLADDDAAIRMVLNQALTRAGYEVRPTGNLSTMWNWVSRGEGDLLITDVMMPDGNAFVGISKAHLINLCVMLLSRHLGILPSFTAVCAVKNMPLFTCGHQAHPRSCQRGNIHVLGIRGGSL